MDDDFADEFEATDGTASFLTPSLFGVVGSFPLSDFSELFELFELFVLLDESDGLLFVIYYIYLFIGFSIIDI